MEYKVISINHCIIISLLIALENVSLEPLLDKAKEHEKKYEWLPATDYYKKAVDLALKKKQLSRAAELHEKIGSCYYKGALQAPSTTVFKKHLKKSILAYEKERKYLLEAKTENYKLRIKHVNALIEYVRAWLVEGFKEKKKLTTKWWTLENEVLTSYENMGKLDLVGKICNDLIYFMGLRFWLASSPTESEKIGNECIGLAEKAIKIYSKLNDNCELARAYACASWYYGQVSGKFPEKTRRYAKKALKLAKKTSDAATISMSYLTASLVAELFGARAISYAEKAVKYAKISRDKHVISVMNSVLGMNLTAPAKAFEDPEKAKKSLANIVEIAQQAIYYDKIVNNINILNHSFCGQALTSLSELETNLKAKLELLEKATEVINEGIERCRKTFGLKGILVGTLLFSLAENLFKLSKFKKGEKEQRHLLVEARLHFRKGFSFDTSYSREFYPSTHSFFYRGLAWVETDLARLETNKTRKIKHLKAAIGSYEEAINLVAKLKDFVMSPFGSSLFGEFYSELGGVLQLKYSINNEERSLVKALESYQKASTIFERAKLFTHLAESHWHIAQLYDLQNDHLEASKNYELASEAYNLAGENIPQLSDFYNDYSLYMQAWSKVEQGRHFHSIEEYNKARQQYEKAAELHELAGPWTYLAPNYFALANMEEAENLSRKENPQKAKETFQNAYEMFFRAEESIKQKLEEITSSDEKEMTQRLFEASGLRRKYCQARMLMEEAKLLDRKGKYLQSSKKYGKAAKSISVIVDKMDVEAEHKELEYVAILCRAWEKMAVAQETSSAESYLGAAAFFEKAKDFCYTKKASLWVLGNINFCKGLAAGLAYQLSLDLDEHSKAKSFIKTAATNYSQAGFGNASEYARATQRLFDAYLYINKAESEANQEIRAKQYQMVENLLQLAAGSFMKAKQPEKTTQVQEILANVREEKELAISLSQVMKAPAIASTTQSFMAPTQTSEVSIGLESFEHANVQANLVAEMKEAKVGESFCLSVEFVNAGREPALLMKVDDFVPSDFIVVKKPEIYRIEETTLNMKGKQLAPLKLVEVKLTLQPSRKGEYQLKPKVHYLDELGQNKSLQLKTLEIKVEEVIIEDRVSTGTQELDSLLLGGIPEEYAVVLSGPPCDERELIVKSFLEAGAKEGTTFCISTEAAGLEGLLENPNFYLFLCNPKPKTKIPDLPNVYQLQSKSDITNLGIALTKAYRSVDKSISKKRICVEILSDVLVKHGTNTTREWISSLITDLGAKGFTILGLLDPRMHDSKDSFAIINLFDGEISIIQSDDPLDCKKSILVKKLRNQDYIKNPICLR